jgi:hypothetical protein
LEYGADASISDNIEGPLLVGPVMSHNVDLAVELLRGGAKKEELYIDNPIHFGPFHKDDLDAFFEECDEYEKVFDLSKIKHAKK